MKKIIKQNGRTITSLDELEDNIPVRVSNTYTIDDLPYSIEISTGVAVRREVWVNMVREFAQEQKIAAIKWVRQIMNWGLKEAKWFVDSLKELEEKTFTLCRQDIYNWCGEAAFDRGHKYYTNGRIFSLVRDGNTFTSFCEGSDDYSVRVTLGEHGIVSSYCSCPVPTQGCKHVAALLLEVLNTYT